MKFFIICVSDEASEGRQHVFEMKRENLTMATLGPSLGESKALLRGMPEFVVAEQVADDLERRCPCPDCGKRRKLSLVTCRSELLARPSVQDVTVASLSCPLITSFRQYFEPGSLLAA
jgi:hypothetical protein